MIRSIDKGLNAEWIRIVKLSREKNISIEEAKKLFLKQYKEKYGKDYEESEELS